MFTNCNQNKTELKHRAELRLHFGWLCNRANHPPSFLPHRQLILFCVSLFTALRVQLKQQEQSVKNIVAHLKLNSFAENTEMKMKTTRATYTQTRGRGHLWLRRTRRMSDSRAKTLGTFSIKREHHKQLPIVSCVCVLILTEAIHIWLERYQIYKYLKLKEIF